MSFALNGPALWYATRATGLVTLLLLTGTMLLGIITAGRFASENWPRFRTVGLRGRRRGHRHRVPARAAVATRQVAATTTAATQPTDAAKTQSVRRSVPVPSPWIRATGQQA